VRRADLTGDASRPEESTTRRNFLLGSTFAAGGVAAATVLRPIPAEGTAVQYWYNITASPYNATTSQTNADVPINQAITDAHNAGGGVVYIPAGTWQLSGKISMQSNVTLRGQDMRQTVLLMPASLNQIVVDHAAATNSSNGIQGAIVENLSINGLWAQSTLAPPVLRYGGGAKHCIARKIAILNSGGHGVRVNTIASSVGFPYTDLLLKDITVEACRGNGFDIQPGTQTTAIMLVGISVRNFGGLTSVSPAYGLRLLGRCQISQVEIGPLANTNIGVGFQTGSDKTVLTNYWINNTGSVGQALVGSPPGGVLLGVGTIETVAAP